MTHADAASRLQQCFAEAIPLSVAMRAKVARWDGLHLALRAPLAENCNPQSSAFGGSLYSLGLLAGWGVLTLGLWEAGRKAQVVVQKAEANYLLPVTGSLEARCEAPGELPWQAFLQRLDRHGRARLQLTSRIQQNAILAFELKARFVALLD